MNWIVWIILLYGLGCSGEEKGEDVVKKHWKNRKTILKKLKGKEKENKKEKKKKKKEMYGAKEEKVEKSK